MFVKINIQMYTASVPAKVKEAPILLVQKDSIDQKTLDVIKRVVAEEIIISGGEASVSQNVVYKLKDYKVTRTAGIHLVNK